jgi:hypothetical protein
LKWRVAMALAATRPRAIVAVADILDAFNGMFPDRAKLAAQSGWNADAISTVDSYAGAEHSLSFPTLRSLLRLVQLRFSDVRVHRGTGYPLAARCPIIACSRARSS